MANILDCGAMSAIGDGDSHLLGGDAAQFASVGATATDERDWAALQTLIDSLSASGGGEVYIPGPCTLRINGERCVRWRDNVVVRGDGAGSKISWGYGAVSGVATAAFPLPAPGDDAYHVYGDADGFRFADGDAGRFIDVAQSVYFTDRYPTNGDIGFGIDFRYDGGLGDILAMGGELLSRGPGESKVQIRLSADLNPARLLLRAHDDSVGVLGPVLSVGQWYSLDVSYTRATDTLKVVIDGQDYVVPGAVAPIAVRWFDRLIIGSRPDTWPGILFGAGYVLQGRAKNFRMVTRYQTFTAPLTDNGGACYNTFRTTIGSGHLFAKHVQTRGSILQVRLRDFQIDASGFGTALYINNCQHLTVEALELTGLYAAYLEKNVYSASVKDCHLFGYHSGFVGAVNAPYGTVLLNNEYHGLKCAFALNETFGTTVVGGWARGPANGGVVVFVNGGSGCTFGGTGFQIMDDGIGPPGADAMLALRSVIEPVFHNCPVTRYGSPGAVVISDGGDRPEFIGFQPTCRRLTMTA